jgi:hypothetical protein
MSDNNSILALNELKSKAALGAFFLLYCVIGLLVDTIIYNMPSLSQGFYMLLTFQVFPMATVGMAAYIFEPKSFASLFSTHPSLQDRLKALGFAS